MQPVPLAPKQHPERTPSADRTYLVRGKVRRNKRKGAAKEAAGHRHSTLIASLIQHPGRNVARGDVTNVRQQCLQRWATWQGKVRGR